MQTGRFWITIDTKAIRPSPSATLLHSQRSVDPCTATIDLVWPLVAGGGGVVLDFVCKPEIRKGGQASAPISQTQTEKNLHGLLLDRAAASLILPNSMLLFFMLHDIIPPVLHIVEVNLTTSASKVDNESRCCRQGKEQGSLQVKG